MNLRKTAALLLSLIMCFSLIVPVGSFAEGIVTAADNAKRSEDLLAFAGRLHNMTEKYSAEYTKKAADTDPYANGRIIVKSAEELDYTGSVAHVNGYNDWHIIQYRTSEEARKAAEAFELVKGCSVCRTRYRHAGESGTRRERIPQLGLRCGLC